ncbi:hypothetical protein QBC40DRAFT_275957 [Triangularia verruculosa]|uniref:Vacuolar ATPase assembly protein VMA22 n=1 Tax=Triangularia verruculosa TaxID=2587418 RepID=A0AAN6XRY3_9PEZI|nr:hypothetical protein QBC40DRAFT_275957 [Triangularia verruculosa]
MSTEKIDSLLQQYLLLLNEYTTLRNNLNTLQSSFYHHLARANFSAQPGVRYYGQDYYDERMQATSRLETTISEDNSTPEFKLVKPSAAKVNPTEKPENTEKKQNSQEEGGDVKSISEDASSSDQTQSEASAPSPDSKKDQDGDEAKPKPTEKKKSNDPLRWFGILTPLPLRQAQADAKRAVEDVIPRLATISEQMKALELEVRRERKKRAKAEKEEAKLKIKELEEKVAAVEV